MANPAQEGDLSGLELGTVTAPATRRQDTVAFAGFLVREDEETLYVADRKGTWVIPRDSLVFMEPWEHGGQIAPDFLPTEGRPVQVGVRAGATIYEIRPWKMLTPDEGLFQRNVRRTVETIFTLGGAAPPIGDHTRLGENQLAALERAFARRLGWDPQQRPRDGRDGGDGGNTSTATIVCYGDCWWGYSDSD